MEKTEDVNINEKDRSSKEVHEQRDDKTEDLKDEDSERDTASSGDNEQNSDNKQESTSVKEATSEGSPEFEKNQNDNKMTEKARNEQAVADSGDSEIKSLESQTNKNEDSEFNLDLSKEPALDDAGRNKMFEEGLKLDKNGKKLDALKCYLKCLVGLKENSRFALLPQCLRNIGDIYYGRDEFDKAISFIQAEKLYYESVLIDDTELQKHIDEVTKQGVTDVADTDIDALRAAEYEQLAKLCLEEKQPQLALEYAGKCTKLRQKVFGDNHPLVQQSLDFFATVYAEVGKVKYTESISKYQEAGEPDITSPTVAWETPATDSPAEPTSILRRRKGADSDREKKVRFDESQVPSDENNEHEEKCAQFVLLCLFSILFIVLVILGVYLLCNYESPSTCRNIRYKFSDAVMQVKFWYYRYWSDSDTKYT